MIFLVALFNAAAAVGIQLIINNYSSLGLLVSFLLSLVTYLVAGVAYYFKDKCDPGSGIMYLIGTALTTLATFALLYPAVGPFREIWANATTFWPKAFLVWVALQALTMVWVALKKPGE